MSNIISTFRHSIVSSFSDLARLISQAIVFRKLSLSPPLGCCHPSPLPLFQSSWGWLSGHKSHWLSFSSMPMGTVHGCQRQDDWNLFCITLAHFFFFFINLRDSLFPNYIISLLFIPLAPELEKLNFPPLSSAFCMFVCVRVRTHRESNLVSVAW